MTRVLYALFAVFAFEIVSSQNKFEGVIIVEYRTDKKEVAKMEVHMKDKLVYLKHVAGGIAKYDYYILNVETREFYTVSKPDKKVVIKYDIDKLMDLYEKNELKDGYRVNSSLIYKPTDKTKDENGIKLTKYVAEDDIYKSSLWLLNEDFGFNQLIPVLRLLNCWNEAQINKGTIYSADVTNKVSKRENSVLVTIKKQPVAKGAFNLPESYLQKDFSKLLDEEKSNKDLKTIIQTFAGF